MANDRYADVIFVLRAYFCDLCNPTKLSPAVRELANKVSLEDRYDLARDDQVCAELDLVPIKSAITGVAPGKINAQKMFRAAAVVTYKKMQIQEQLAEWPEGWEKLGIRALADELCGVEEEV